MAATGQLSVAARLVKPGGGLSTLSPWLAHPHRHEHRLDAGQQPLAAQEPQVRLAVLPHRSRHHVAAHEVARGLHAVADAEQRDPGLEQALVGQRGVVLPDARRPAESTMPV